MDKDNANIIISPRIIYESLGSKNIEVDSIVFAEQIKNSYDAHSKCITIDFSNYVKDEIIIYDDGDGMDYDDIISNWFLIGTSNKLNNKKNLGGKGIGRLSLFRLADSITIITKKLKNMEYEFTVNKAQLESFNTTGDVEIQIKENKTSAFFYGENIKGTKIVLHKLKKLNFNEIFIDLQNVTTPNKKAPINIKCIYPSFFQKTSYRDVNKSIVFAPFKCYVTFEGKTLSEYRFECELKSKVVYNNFNTNELKEKFMKLQDISLGKITVVLYNFYLAEKFCNTNSIPRDEILNNFLEAYQGINVYRENFKVYGHGKDDWLKLAEKRVNAPSKCIDNRLSFGYINLLRPDSDKLEEKTSREGFIKNEYLNYFKNAIELIVKQFNKDRFKSIKLMPKNGFHDTIIDDPPKGYQNSEDYSKSEKHLETDDKESSNKFYEDTKNNTIININENENIENVFDNFKHDKSDKSTEFEDKYITVENLKKPKKIYSDKLIIDASFICPKTAPEKIKRIIYELQTINSKFIYAQGLLLRCLIDISTQYAQSRIESIKRNNNDLNGNILSVLNYISNNNLIDKKYLDRIRSEIKQDKIIEYFNGIAHEYNYKSNFEIIKRVWDTFEMYILFCIRL
ncbi:ATP-binding protein [Clostridium pasteurianum]|uniref:Molecular chaperone of HSP90 family n=1 Tax=Clostridium pasteurianum BC1 TaxID=86416 RepID=R4KBX4_CLOPA|nr:ATP-binding protein [Clostridium pasteurianum]AGK97125.1 hypothetical protein Clopa_2253 [Clostridium pasteurianum BC1]